MSTCKFCGVRIHWVRHKGKVEPFEYHRPNVNHKSTCPEFVRRRNYIRKKEPLIKRDDVPNYRELERKLDEKDVEMDYCIIDDMM